MRILINISILKPSWTMQSIFSVIIAVIGHSLFFRECILREIPKLEGLLQMFCQRSAKLITQET